MRRRAWTWGKPWRHATNPIAASGWAEGAELERNCRFGASFYRVKLGARVEAVLELCF